MKDQHPKHLQLKVGDEVVFCPYRGHTPDRGMTGTVVSLINHLEVQVKWDSKFLIPGNGGRILSYNLRLATACHTCVNRLTHLSMGLCPLSWKSVKPKQKKEEIDDEEADVN
jgi:hypothetical protein